MIDFGRLIAQTPYMTERVIIIRYEPVSRINKGAYPKPELREQGRTSASTISQPRNPRYQLKEEIRDMHGTIVRDIREFYFDYGAVNVTTFNRQGGPVTPRSAILWNDELYDVYALQEFKAQGYVLAFGIRRNQVSAEVA